MHKQLTGSLVAYGAAIVIFSVVLAAATKASIREHWASHLGLTACVSMGLIAVAVWQCLKPEGKTDLVGVFRNVFARMLAAVLLVLPALVAIDRLYDSSLVSGRSYGSVLWSAIVMYVFFTVWRVMARKYHDGNA